MSPAHYLKGIDAQRRVPGDFALPRQRRLDALQARLRSSPSCPAPFHSPLVRRRRRSQARTVWLSTRYRRTLPSARRLVPRLATWAPHCLAAMRSTQRQRALPTARPATRQRSHSKASRCQVSGMRPWVVVLVVTTPHSTLGGSVGGVASGNYMEMPGSPTIRTAQMGFAAQWCQPVRYPFVASSHDALPLGVGSLEASNQC